MYFYIHSLLNNRTFDMNITWYFVPLTNFYQINNLSQIFMILFYQRDINYKVKFIITIKLFKTYQMNPVIANIQGDIHLNV